MLSWDDMIDAGHLIIGSPDTVREQLEHAAKTLRFGHMLLLLHFGNMRPDLVRYNTDLFAEKVMPGLRTLWSEYDDRWWPAACA